MIHDDPPELEVTLEEATATRDSTDIEPSDPESTAGVAASGERQFAKNPGEIPMTVSYAPGTHPTSPGGSEVVAGELADPSLPADEQVDGPGLPDASLPGETPEGPDPKLATLAAWGGVLIAALWLLDFTGVMEA